jgi:hypothetical protein
MDFWSVWCMESRKAWVREVVGHRIVVGMHNLKFFLDVYFVQKVSFRGILTNFKKCCVVHNNHCVCKHLK